MTSGNPFSTRNVRPGALPFLFPAGQSVETLLARLWQTDGWAQIVGPHGSGKSTLLSSLIPAIERDGRPTTLIALHDGQRTMPRRWKSNAALLAPAILIVDGYEQLSRWSRFSLRRFCRQGRLGLLVTAHASVGFPTLYETTTSPAIVERIVEQLLRGCNKRISSQEIAHALARHGNDVRETLFDLYDAYERR